MRTGREIKRARRDVLIAAVKKVRCCTSILIKLRSFFFFFSTSAQRKGYRERERESLAVVAVSAPRIKLVGEVDELASSDNITAWGGVLHTRIYTYTRGLSRQTATLILHSYCVCVCVCVCMASFVILQKERSEREDAEETETDSRLFR